MLAGYAIAVLSRTCNGFIPSFVKECAEVRHFAFHTILATFGILRLSRPFGSTNTFLLYRQKLHKICFGSIPALSIFNAVARSLCSAYNVDGRRKDFAWSSWSLTSRTSSKRLQQEEPWWWKYNSVLANRAWSWRWRRSGYCGNKWRGLGRTGTLSGDGRDVGCSDEHRFPTSVKLFPVNCHAFHRLHCDGQDISATSHMRAVFSIHVTGLPHGVRRWYLSTAASKCPGISCMIIMSSNGKKVRKELIIDLSMMNLLVTCCAMIAPDCSEHWTTNQCRSNRNQIRECCIVLRTDAVEKFKSAMLTDANIMPRNPSCLRQLSSGFEHFSTYVFLRKTLDASTTHDVCPQQFHLAQYPKQRWVWIECRFPIETCIVALVEVCRYLSQENLFTDKCWRAPYPPCNSGPIWSSIQCQS